MNCDIVKYNNTNFNSSLWPKNLNDEFDWEKRLLEQKEEQIYDAVP
jgi:hypothetical protein